MRIIRSCDYRRMPWKNGGGETIEVAIAPPGAELDEFNWRVSMALVSADGPFSAFAGLDRTLSILEGKGIRLSVSSQTAVDITPDSEPYGFPADAPAHAWLIDGPVVDLNVMTRRGWFTHRVASLKSATSVEWRLNSDLTLIVSRTTPLRIDHRGSMTWLEAGDTAVFEDRGGTLRMVPKATAEIYIIELNASPIAP